MDDRRLGATGRLDGTAVFTPVPDGLAYAESGLMRFGPYRGMATQSYRFELVGPAQALVRFADGRAFHRLDLGTGIAAVTHDCAPDRYRGRYRVVSPSRWVLHWLVEGPRKDLRITSLYLRD